jgi:hypothetical protein
MHFSHYGAVVRDSTFLNGVMTPRCVKESTATHLKDPKTGEELLLIGTLNHSTRLAYRSKQAIEAFAPDAVLVQASSSFLEASRSEARSQEDFTNVLASSGYLDYLDYSTELPWSLRSAAYAYKRFILKGTLLNLMRIPKEYPSLFIPGLEAKFALNAAEKLNSQIYLAGEEFDDRTMQSLVMEKDMGVFKPLFTYFFSLCDAWSMEATDLHKMLRYHSFKDLSENFFNKDRIAWVVRFAEKMVPAQKKLLIDKRSEDFIWAIEKKLTGKKKAVVVNQWHMEGLEKLWRSLHGIEVRRPATSGTEDLPLEEIQHYLRSNERDRKVVEQRTNSEMATSSVNLVPYKDESRSHYA